MSQVQSAFRRPEHNHQETQEVPSAYTLLSQQINGLKRWEIATIVLGGGIKTSHRRTYSRKMTQRQLRMKVIVYDEYDEDKLMSAIFESLPKDKLE